MQKLKIFLLFISFLSSICAAQNDILSWDFYNYLRRQNLNKDALEWLNYYPNPSINIELSNKIYLEKASVFLLLNKTDSANFYYRKITDISADTSIIEKAICVAFIEKDTSAIGFYLKNNDHLSSNYEHQLSYKILKRDSCFSNSLNGNEFFKQLVSKYSSHKKKSSFIAAILSSVIPGSGKLYLGYKYQARSSFFLNAMFGLVLAESMLIPVSNLYTGFCLATSSVFYIGNIWGSAALAKKRDNDFYNQINEDISNYYYRKLFP